MAFSAVQVEQLLRPINHNRVLRDGKGHSHVSQQDITAHLIRIFGFGGFDTEILAAECVFETERVHPKTGEGIGRWDVCYRTLLRLTVRDADGSVVCRFEDGSTATAQNQTRGDAHDLAYKSALSLAKKRAAINLGDQFGLSLYNRGQLEALVRATLVMPGEEAEPAGDMQEGVPQQVALGHDEIDHDLNAEPEVAPAPQAPPGPSVAAPKGRTADEIAAEAADAGTGTERLRELGGEAETLGVLDAIVVRDGRQGTLRELITYLGKSRTPAKDQHHRHMHALFRDLGITDRDERLKATAHALGREVTTSKDLSIADAERLIADLKARKAARVHPNTEGAAA